MTHIAEWRKKALSRFNQESRGKSGWWKSRSFLLGIALAFVTVVRFCLGVMTPLYFQPGAGYDDWLMVEYAASMLDGDWLGDFCMTTYAKTVSFSLLLAAGYLLGVPYAVALTGLFIVAVALLALAFKQLSGNDWLAVAVYLIVLFTPAMFHEENVQKIYRGGYIIVFTLLLFAAIIGMFASAKRQKMAVLVRWSVLAAVSLPLFWFMKEDSIWVLPFVVVGLIFTGAEAVRAQDALGRKAGRLLCCALPLLALTASIVAYQSANQWHYGEYASTDRSGTYYKEVIEDLMRIEDPGIGVNWITHDMLNKAMEASQTLREAEPYIEEMYESGWQIGSDGEIYGDIIVWELREAFDKAGVYSESGSEANEFYRKVDEELKAAFENGALERQEGRLFISAVARGYSPDELIEYYSRAAPVTLGMLVTYSENATSLASFVEPSDRFNVMREITRSDAVALYDGGIRHFAAKVAVSVERKVVLLYQLVNPVLFALAIAGLVLLAASVIKGRPCDLEVGGWRILLVSIGLLASCGVLSFGVDWFCNFLSDRKIYDYITAAIPLVQACEAIGLVCLAKGVRCLRGR